MRDPKSYSDGTSARLAGLAQRDAARVTPEFSQTLHGKILGEIHRASMNAPAAVVPRRSARGLIAPLAAIVTLALVAASTSLFHSHSRPVPSDIQRASAVMRPETPPVLAIDAAVIRANLHAQDMVQTAMNQQQWVGLDRDVRTATRYLVDQVPFRTAWESADQDR